MFEVNVFLESFKVEAEIQRKETFFKVPTIYSNQNLHICFVDKVKKCATKRAKVFYNLRSTIKK